MVVCSTPPDDHDMLIPTQFWWNPRETSGTGSLEDEQEGYTLQLSKLDRVMQLAKFDHVITPYLVRRRDGTLSAFTRDRKFGLPMPGTSLGDALGSRRRLAQGLWGAPAWPARPRPAGPGPASPAQAGALGHPLGT